MRVRLLVTMLNLLISATITHAKVYYQQDSEDSAADS